MLRMWSGDIFERQSKLAGDFAAAAIVAHEFGHHVQDELSTQAGNFPPPKGKNGELIADCSAGIWAADFYFQGGLEVGDFEEAVTALEVIGDHNILSPNHYGTPEERATAFQVGYHGVRGGRPADPATCIRHYWR